MSTRSKSPVDDEVVEAFRKDASGDWDFAASDFSNSSGSYALKDIWALAPGSYKIRVLDRSTRPYGYFYYGQYRSLGNAREVELTAGDVVSGLDVWMGDDPAIAGRIVDQGVPKADVRVEAYQKRAGDAWAYVGADYTDTAGRYRVMCQDAGTYTLKIVDLAGTSDTSDDVARFLGGAQTIEQASTRAVQDDRTRALDDIEFDQADEPRVTRVTGTSPYAAAIAASKATFPADQSSSAVLASGARYSEALCAAGLAGAVNGPVLLTGQDRLYKGLLNEFDRLGVRDVYILGNDAMVAGNQDRLLRALGYNVIRISGKDRFEVSANVARKTATLSAVTSETPVFVVSGWTRADALAAGPFAYRHKGLVLLTDRTVTPSSLKSAVTALGVKRAYAIGQYTDLPNGSLKGLKDAGVTVERLSTSTSSYVRGAQVLAAAEARGWGTPTTIALAPGPSLGECTTAGSIAGRAGGAVLFARPTDLTDATTAAIRSRSASVAALTAHARSSSIRTPVLVKAGSQ
jgi:putative cell wall-binding protein